MKKSRIFRFLAFATYLPLPLLGIMVIFAILGKMMQVGWLESAPDVLMIPTLLAYYISLLLGVIYGLFKKEDSVYLMALISVGVWIIAFVFGRLLSLPREAMIAINVVLLAALLILHVLQYRATKRWDLRLSIGRH
jgi:hypothetical protein